MKKFMNKVSKRIIAMALAIAMVNAFAVITAFASFDAESTENNAGSIGTSNSADVSAEEAEEAPEKNEIEAGQALVAAALAAEDETLENLMTRLLKTGNAEEQDVRKYDIATKELADAYNNVINGEGRVAYNCYFNVTFSRTLEGGKVATIQLYNADSGVESRYQKVLATIDDIKSGIDDNMSDHEVMLYVHEYIVSHSDYKKDSDYAYTASGPLALGYGWQLGYTNAMILMLRELGFEASYVSSDAMSHCWVLANLDGEWYHIDPAWADTKISETGDISHRFFLRSDSEYKNDSADKHHGWDANVYTNYPKATAETYAGWFVHDVTSQMYYADSAWYYVWNGDIVKSDIDGNNREVLVAANGSALKITSFNDGDFTYERDGKEVTEIEEAEESMEALITRLITTGNGEVQDVSKYGLTIIEVMNVYNSVIAKERIAYECYCNLYFTRTLENGIVKTFQLVNVDSGFSQRYEKTKATIDDIISGLDDRMSDMEKILSVHDYIVSTTSYSAANDYCHFACGPLALGYGACMGYARAVILALQEIGFEAQHISSNAINHSWLMVNIDGKWYHIDPTWDDTRSGVTGEVGHAFFLKTDSEFKNAATNKHYGWDESAYVSYPVSNSTTYSNLFVHNVTGKMYYTNGEWYYLWNGDIVKSGIDGNNREVLVSANGSTLKITSFNDGDFTYSRK